MCSLVAALSASCGNLRSRAGDAPGAGGTPCWKFGSEGKAVERLQQQLNDLGYDITVDGSFGRETKAAIRHFQAEQGLKPDGIFGLDTKATLKEQLDAGWTASDFDVDEWADESRTKVKEVADELLKFGDEGDEVEELQNLLTELGYGIDVDGVFGRHTKAAIRHFQDANELRVDGVAGPATWRAIREAVDQNWHAGDFEASDWVEGDDDEEEEEEEEGGYSDDEEETYGEDEEEYSEDEDYSDDE